MSMVPSKSKSDNVIQSETVLVPCRDESGKTLPELKSVFIRIENKPFRIYTNFFVGDRIHLERELKRRESVDMKGLQLDDEKTFSGITFPCTAANGHSFVTIWMPEFNWTLEDFETLSHECLHATIMVMRMSGVRAKIFSAEDDASCDDEGICYSQSSMFSSILMELVRHENKLFKKTVGKSKTVRSRTASV